MDEGEAHMLEAIRAEFPAWHPWVGVTGMCYAGRVIAGTKVTVQGHNLTVLRERIVNMDEKAAR
jgi:hypothetical protein